MCYQGFSFTLRSVLVRPQRPVWDWHGTGVSTHDTLVYWLARTKEKEGKKRGGLLMVNNC